VELDDEDAMCGGVPLTAEPSSMRVRRVRRPIHRRWPKVVAVAAGGFVHLVGDMRKHVPSS
jgi:hypothetical protein